MQGPYANCFESVARVCLLPFFRLVTPASLLQKSGLRAPLAACIASGCSRRRGSIDRSTVVGWDSQWFGNACCPRPNPGTASHGSSPRRNPSTPGFCSPGSSGPWTSLRESCKTSLLFLCVCGCVCLETTMPMPRHALTLQTAVT